MEFFGSKGLNAEGIKLFFFFSVDWGGWIGASVDGVIGVAGEVGIDFFAGVFTIDFFLLAPNDEYLYYSESSHFYLSPYSQCSQICSFLCFAVTRNKNNGMSILFKPQLLKICARTHKKLFQDLWPLAWRNYATDTKNMPFRTALKKFFLLVHPDLFLHHPDERVLLIIVIWK
jgi:hypothetical protein